jgi:cytochrome bd ubiquinol oxidase subunit II
MPSYEVLRLIWWALLGVLLIGLAVMDGFDLGTAILLPFVGETDAERRIVINTVGPVWEGNQVWLILGGGAIFAAWPPLYAVAFSGFYLAMFLVLCALILRPAGFKYRSKLTNPIWRNVWDWILFVGGLVPALIFGVAFGNVLEGVPFRFDDALRMTYEGTLFGLLNPFALLGGLVSIAMLTMHGGAYLALKAEEPVAGRAARFGARAGGILIALFAIGGLWVGFLYGYSVSGVVPHDGPSNPLLKHVETSAGAWLANYGREPLTLAAPFLGFGGAAVTILLLQSPRRYAFAIVSSALSVAGVIATAGLSVFPFLLPSSLSPDASLIIWDASSSQLTLFIMLIATMVFLPIVLAYTAWVYHVLRGRVTAAYVAANSTGAY